MEYHWNNLVIIFHLAPCVTTGLVTNWLTKSSTNVVVAELFILLQYISYPTKVSMLEKPPSKETRGTMECTIQCNLAFNRYFRII